MAKLGRRCPKTQLRSCRNAGPHSTTQTGLGHSQNAFITAFLLKGSRSEKSDGASAYFLCIILTLNMGDWGSSQRGYKPTFPMSQESAPAIKLAEALSTHPAEGGSLCRKEIQLLRPKRERVHKEESGSVVCWETYPSGRRKALVPATYPRCLSVFIQCLITYNAYTVLGARTSPQVSPLLWAECPNH